jgi:hypothetical protein
MGSFLQLHPENVDMKSAIVSNVSGFEDCEDAESDTELSTISNIANECISQDMSQQKRQKLMRFFFLENKYNLICTKVNWHKIQFER